MAKASAKNKPEQKIRPKKRHTIVLTVDEDVLRWLEGDLMTTRICGGILNGGQQFAMLVIKAIRSGDPDCRILTNFKGKKRP